MTSPALPDLPKAYEPEASELEIAARWADAGVFAAPSKVPEGTPSYSIVIPPPNVTAALHLGHALNNTLQDVLIRYHRMRGFATLWMPGTDHAGIATQTVVEKRLLSQGIKRLDMGREAFVEKTQEWKDEYEAVIIDQLKGLGASCDWDRVRFTMDDMCAVAVRHAFFELFRDGLVYRGKRLVNWDPVTRTALADDEVEMENVDGHMWYLKYPLEDGSGHITVATTRPETMLGDTAVAVNPNDPRAAELKGKNVVLPIVGRVVPIVEDDYVVMADPESSEVKAQFASGFLKVTPAHDTNDWDIALRHDLGVINILGPDGAISDQYGWEDISDEARPFVGMSREDARDAVVAWFDSNGLLEEVRDYSHSVGHSYRSHVPIEPWLSDQWYVRVTDDRFRGSAMRAQEPEQTPPLPDGVPARTDAAGDGDMTFYPSRYARTYHQWHDGIRDWCISRQLWWGHQIPVWTRLVALTDAPAEVADAEVDVAVAVASRWVDAGAAHLARKITDSEVEEAVCVPPASTLGRVDRLDASMDEPALVAALEADGFTRDLDVLDTWFSSGLWPLSTMGWPWPQDFPETEGLIESYNPTSVLSTGRDIITLWVSRMTMFNRYFQDGDVAFDDVYIHPLIQDGHGQKMSKTLGNGVDPRDIIGSHGADAMRFGLVQMATDTQDLRMPVDMICAHTGAAFQPEFITTSAGHVVAAPTQACPSDPSKTMVSAYGIAAGLVEATDETPLAGNTSPKFDLGRNFANKVWNATRFALKRLEGAEAVAEPVDLASAQFADRWIIARLHQTLATIDDALANYHFNACADAIYDFVWRDVCDVYLEAVKPTVDNDPNQKAVLGAVLDAVLRIMHPVCPFVTEALWPHVSAARPGEVAGVDLPASDLVAGASWPEIADGTIDGSVVATFERAERLVSMIRTLRSERQVNPKQKIVMHVPAAVQELLDTSGGVVETLAGVGEVESIDADRPAVASAIAFEGTEVLLSGLTDEVDVDAERSRLDKEIEGLNKRIGGFKGKLSNDGYVNGAPAEMVEETRGLLASAEADLAAAQSALGALA